MLGAEVLAQSIQRSGSEAVFSLSGNQIMPLYDAFIDTSVRLVHVRHECAAVFMADSYAQLSGNHGVALVTAGPGFANALGGLYSAQMAESPVILISGDSPVSQDGKRAFQGIGRNVLTWLLVVGPGRCIWQCLSISFLLTSAMTTLH